MIRNYLKSFILDKIGNEDLSEDFINLLKYYNLTYEDGLEIQKRAFEVLDDVNESDDCLLWKFRLVRSIELHFSLIHGNKYYYDINHDKFRQYFCKVPFSNHIIMKSSALNYFKDKDNIDELIDEFNNRKFTKYRYTFFHYLENSKISKITNIDDILDGFENYLNLNLSYTLDDAVDFLIENTSKEYIDYIRSFKDIDDYSWIS